VGGFQPHDEMRITVIKIIRPNVFAQTYFTQLSLTSTGAEREYRFDCLMVTRWLIPSIEDIRRRMDCCSPRGYVYDPCLI
jgi:hypothetical protein